MGIFDKLKKQAEKAVDEHGDKIAQGIDKGAAAAKGALDKLGGKNDDTPDGKGRRP